MATTTTTTTETVELHTYDATTYGHSRHEEECPPPDDNVTTAIQPLEVTGVVKLKVFSAAFCFLNAGINDGSLGALIPYILRHYDISTAWMAIPYGTAFAGWLVAALVGGYARVTLGTGGVIVAGAVLQFLTQVFRFWFPPFGIFSFSFFLVALGQGLQEPQANTFVTTLKSAHRWLGLIHGCYALGGFAGPLIASAIAANSNGNWAAFYYVPLGIGALNLILCSYAFKDETTFRQRHRQTSGQRASATAFSELKATLKLKAVWLVSVFFFLYLGAAITAGGWVVEFLVVVRDGRLSRVGYISSAYNGGTALGRFLLAEPTFRLGERRMLLLYSVLAVALQVVFWQVPNIVVNAVSVSFLGFVLGPFFATAVSVGSKLIPKELQQSGLAFIFVMAQAGGAIFPAVTGVISSQSGVETLQPILVGLLAAMTVAWAIVPIPKKMSVQ
ncbi:hypothetical protein M409DRAFT_30484 [Zasmidium cellare ATCC 36951]|uniref:Major facilitator superfamily (MFS) profile domain-containing protein n=1 Tax=Zasmidium cellare ATCC 36951 TaxID=1080233 RepID=A0A6A6BW39_ZASCE|nr:uncharacterized protein M409DRAFT_30484 [Zasmidium cellare ATCC 36951]KAF2159064.1 hypothetical protein M409DRAFT_30484 [Zasmidium cellare ATCC 36951]